jgi:hypothetical protein
MAFCGPLELFLDAVAKWHSAVTQGHSRDSHFYAEHIVRTGEILYVHPVFRQIVTAEYERQSAPPTPVEAMAIFFGAVTLASGMIDFRSNSGPIAERGASPRGEGEPPS